MIELSRTQDEECGDGTTSVIVLGACRPLSPRGADARAQRARSSRSRSRVVLLLIGRHDLFFDFCLVSSFRVGGHVEYAQVDV